MSPLGVALLFLLLMTASFWGGLGVQRTLRDHHRSRESVESIRVIITLLVTFSALVLGLLISSPQARFTAMEAGLRGLSIDITQLDQRLREYGPEAEPLRADLILYTKAAIADTWPDEPRPPGDYPIHLHRLDAGSEESTSLSAVLNAVDLAIRVLVPKDDRQRALAANLNAQMEALLDLRLTLIENARSAISWPFLSILVFWLVVIFAIVGLSSSRNWLVITVMTLAALSLASSIFLALELDTPFDGYITVSSAPLRDALARQMEPTATTGLP